MVVDDPPPGERRAVAHADSAGEAARRAGYWRLYADARGETHFEEVATALLPTAFSPPAPPLNVALLFPATGCRFAGASADWPGERPHPSPERQLFCTLRGEYAVIASDGTTRHFPPGGVLLLEDVDGAGHATRIVGTDGVLLLAVALAE